LPALIARPSFSNIIYPVKYHVKIVQLMFIISFHPKTLAAYQGGKIAIDITLIVTL
jgi:hypothetical protein